MFQLALIVLNDVSLLTYIPKLSKSDTVPENWEAKLAGG